MTRPEHSPSAPEAAPQSSGRDVLQAIQNGDLDDPPISHHVGLRFAQIDAATSS